MLRTMAKPRVNQIALARCLAVSAFAMAPIFPVMAQEIDRLVAFRPENRAGSAAAATVIAEMIAERSESMAVRSRARAMAPQGSLALGADELLMDIGAHAFIGSITGGGAVVPVAVAPVTRPAAPAKAPVVQTVVVPTPAPAPAPASVATPVSATPAATPAATPTGPRPQQNWGVTPTFSGEMRDLGGDGGSSGGGGGGGWN